MGDEFQSSKPIYMQIVDKICHQIARNELKPGNKLPSVREMAIQAGVNPNTVQRTYSELERMAIVETKRGQGTFVTDKSEIVHELKERLQFEIIDSFVNNMNELGFSNSEMMSGIERYFRKKEGSAE